jgi:hypothetical protein
MNAVAEKPSRASIEQLEEALASRRAEQEKLEAKIADLEREEAEARDAELREKPGKRFYLGATSRGEKLRRERFKAENQLANVRLEIETLELLAVEEGAAVAISLLAAKTDDAEKLSKAEDTVWREAGEAFETFVGIWNRLADSLEAREVLRVEVEQAGIAEQVRALDPEAFSEWESAIAYANGQRVPVDLGAFVEILIELCCDPRSDGHRPSTTELISRNADASMRPAGEPEQTRRMVETGSRKYPGRLANLLPDLRGHDRRVQLSASAAASVSTFGGTPANPGTSFGVR